ncbi:glycoside hydrolase family 16 protein [Priestia endophytica]|uniref:glycoside hydrolase family 16 protein n=1 Tax=Priestia endophytica TaxID=135735 RepID=UPI00227DAB60|nr:glycoside hydrolase family 16 protein [Priestia endophytica]MCY8234826.1 glycoside hydrolase family 16 protein [Priestia endophytica]
MGLIQFSGYEWITKDRMNSPIGPGPNYFNPNNAYVDQEGKLHLKTTYNDTLKRWECAQATNVQSLGYGTYRFYIQGRVDNLDPQVVLGLYTYDDTDDKYAHREIDIEFSKWGNVDPTYKNSQYVIQPHEKDGNVRRFETTLNGESTTHEFKWTPQEVYFRSLHGFYKESPSNGYIINEWTYKGVDVPPAGHETPRINLWLSDGKAPQNGKEHEITIDKFEFDPY